jgi:hypothetical protein
MFKTGKLTPEEIVALKLKRKGGKEIKRKLLFALHNLEVGGWIDVEDTYYSYPSVRARVSEVMAQLGNVELRTTRVPFHTRVYRFK